MKERSLGIQGRTTQFFSLIKFSHTLFALPFALIGYSLAVTKYGHSFSWVLFIKVLICMVAARTAAMAFNRYLDRRIDALNPRTALREIPAGKIKASEALVLTILSCLVFMVTCWTLNPLCFYLSFPALFIVLYYSFTKYFTSWCHLVLGLGLSLSPIGAFLAVTGYFASLPLFFSLIVLSWVAGFDILYSLQDMDFDRKQQLFSVPARFGMRKSLWIARFLHFLSALGVVWVGWIGAFHPLYWVGVALFIGLLMFQHKVVWKGDLSRINLAFATTNGVISLFYAAFTILALIFGMAGA